MRSLSKATFLVALAFASLAQAQSIEPGRHGAGLVNALRATYRPTTPVGYRPAREAMFETIDNDGGKVRCVYTGVEIPTNGIPSGTVMNTEHTWPQSLFDKRFPMRSDLHHLFPTLSKVNEERANHPFREIPDFETKEFYDKNTPVTTAPASGIRNRFSESDNHSFEPREDHEGNVARAMFYFWVVYGNDGITPGFIDGQLSTLALWHKADPVDQAERERNAAIKAVQGNDNPFILDATLVDRVLGTAPVGPDESDDDPESPDPSSPSDGPATVTIDVACWNMQSDFDAETDESDEVFLADRLAEKEGIRLWGLSEVRNRAALIKFREGAQRGEDGEFVEILGKTGGSDHLAILYDSTIFEQIGPPFELKQETLLTPRLRASLGVRLRGKTTGQEFLFVVNHLKRGDTDDPNKLKQSRNLNAWLREQSLPVMLVGDFNYDFELEGGDEAERSQGFDLLTDDGVCRWVRPENSVKTQASDGFAPSMLDFIFVANEPFGWTGFSEVLEREGNEAATAVDFDDDVQNTDHRPVRATLIFDSPAP